LSRSPEISKGRIQEYSREEGIISRYLIEAQNLFFSGRLGKFSILAPSLQGVLKLIFVHPAHGIVSPVIEPAGFVEALEDSPGSGNLPFLDGGPDLGQYPRDFPLLKGFLDFRQLLGLPVHDAPNRSSENQNIRPGKWFAKKHMNN